MESGKRMRERRNLYTYSGYLQGRLHHFMNNREFLRLRERRQFESDRQLASRLLLEAFSGQEGDGLGGEKGERRRGGDKGGGGRGGEKDGDEGGDEKGEAAVKSTDHIVDRVQGVGSDEVEINCNITENNSSINSPKDSIIESDVPLTPEPLSAIPQNSAVPFSPPPQTDEPSPPLLSTGSSPPLSGDLTPRRPDRPSGTPNRGLTSPLSRDLSRVLFGVSRHASSLWGKTPLKTPYRQGGRKHQGGSLMITEMENSINNIAHNVREGVNGEVADEEEGLVRCNTILRRIRRQELALDREERKLRDRDRIGEGGEGEFETPQRSNTDIINNINNQQSNNNNTSGGCFYGNDSERGSGISTPQDEWEGFSGGVGGRRWGEADERLNEEEEDERIQHLEEELESRQAEFNEDLKYRIGYSKRTIRMLIYIYRQLKSSTSKISLLPYEEWIHKSNKKPSSPLINLSHLERSGATLSQYPMYRIVPVEEGGYMNGDNTLEGGSGAKDKRNRGGSKEKKARVCQSIVFKSLVDGQPRTLVAAAFFELLTLKSRAFVDLYQNNEEEDIYITTGPLASLLSQ